jgi:hypothetical protein
MWILRVRPTKYVILSGLSLGMWLVSAVFGAVKAFYIFTNPMMSLYALNHYLVFSSFFVCSVLYLLFVLKGLAGAIVRPSDRPGYKPLPSLWEEHDEAAPILKPPPPSMSINNGGGGMLALGGPQIEGEKVERMISCCCCHF